MKAKGIMVVTGGSRGIGATTSILAAKHGFDVCINYNTNKERAQQVAREVESHGRKAMIFQAHIAHEAEIKAMFAAVDAQLGQVSVLVNSAGVSGSAGRVDQLTAEGLGLLLQTNIQGTFLCCKEAILRMSTQHGGSGGTIVNVS